MKVCFVSKGTLNSVWQESLDKISGKDLVVFGFNGLGLVSYKKELSGETEYFQDLAKLSKQISSVVICGLDTDTYGTYRHSGVIADNGKILGVVDMTHFIDESEFVAGGGLKVYDTSVGKIGILIGDDLLFFETSHILSVCDADVIICIMKKIDNFMPQIMLRALSYSNGVAMSLVSKNYCLSSNIHGEIICASSLDIVDTDVKIEKDYHLISTKKRGFIRDLNK